MRDEAPAQKNARESPTRPSPHLNSPKLVLHADKTTRSALSFSSRMFRKVKSPSFTVPSLLVVEKTKAGCSEPLNLSGTIACVAKCKMAYWERSISRNRFMDACPRKLLCGDSEESPHSAAIRLTSSAEYSRRIQLVWFTPVLCSPLVASS